MDITTALDNYIALLTQRNHALADNDYSKYRYTYTVGKTWAKVIKQSILTGDTSQSVHTFISMATGAIHFAASWSSPSKRKVGSIFATNPLDGTTCGGGVYAR